jgi:hypothetical protein
MAQDDDCGAIVCQSPSEEGKRYDRIQRDGRPPQPASKGTPVPELWLRDLDGELIEIFARLTDDEMTSKPVDESPVVLAHGTEPQK